MAYQNQVLGNNVLVRILHIEEETSITLLDDSKRVSRFSLVELAGPECKILKVGDDVLIPDRASLEDPSGRVVFALGKKEYAVFPETAVRVIRKEAEEF